MKNAVAFEWKRPPWQLGLVGLLLGFLVLILPAIHWQPVPVNYQKYNYWPVTVTSEKRMVQHWLEEGAQTYSPTATKAVKPYNLADTRRQGRHYQVMVKAYRRGDYLTVDRQIIKALSEGVTDGLRWYDGDMAMLVLEGQANLSLHSAAALRAPYEYLVAHKVNRLPVLGLQSGAGQAITAQLEKSTFFLVLLAVLVLMLGLTYTQEASNGTAQFMRTIPESDLKLALAKFVPLLAWFNLAVVGAVILAMTFFALWPDQNFGSLLVPYIYNWHGEIFAMALWQFLGLEWLALNVWAFFLSGLAYLLSMGLRRPVALCFVLAVVTFARQLGLLNLVPLTWQDFVPAKYTLLPDMLARQVTFVNQKPWQWLLLFLGFGVLAWGLAAGAIWLRDHRRSRTKGGRANA